MSGLLKFVVLVGLVAFAASQPITFAFSGNLNDGAAQSVVDGIKVAFASWNAAPPACGLLAGRTLSLTTTDDGGNANTALSNAQTAATSALALLGQYGLDPSNTVATWAQSNGVPLLAPTSGASGLHNAASFNNFVVNVRASILDEVISSVSFLTNLKRVFRISYVVSDDAYGTEVANAVNEALSQIGLKPISTAVFNAAAPDVNGAATAVYGTVTDAVFIAAPIDFAKSFMLLAQTQAVNAIPLFVLVSGNARLDQMSSASGGALPVSLLQNVMGSQVVPSLNDTSIQLIQSFNAATTTFAGQISANISSYTLEGYLIGRFVMAALQRVTAVTRPALMDALYNTGAFSIDGVFVGPYGPDCPELAQGCRCNQGLRRVWLLQYTSLSVLEYIDQTDRTFSWQGCEAINSDFIFAPLTFGMTGAFATGTSALTFGEEIRQGIALAFEQANGNAQLGRKVSLVTYDDATLTSKNESAVDFLINKQQVFAFTGVSGYPTSTYLIPRLKNASIPLLGPTTGDPSLVRKGSLANPFNRDVLVLRPSLYDEIFTALEYLRSVKGDTALRTVSMLYSRDTTGRLWRDALRRVLTTQYGIKQDPPTLEEVPYTLETGTKLRQGGLFLRVMSALVIFAPPGIAVQVIQSLPTSQDTLYLVMSPAGIERLRDSLVAANPATAPLYGPKVFAISPVPLPSGSTQAAASFRAAVRDYGVTGVTATSGRFEGYVTGRFVLRAVGQVQGQLTRDAMMNVLYQLGRVEVDDLVYANFSDDNRFCTPLKPDLCACNQMSRGLYVNTLAADLNATAVSSATFSPFNIGACGWEARFATKINPEYRDVPQAGSIIVLVLSGIFLLICVILGVLIFIYRSRSIISSSNLGFMYLTLLGLMLAYADVIPWALKPTDLTCALIPILGGLGFVLVVGSMIVKLWRIYRVLNNTALLSAPIGYRDYFIQMGVIIGLEVLILIVWNAIDDFRLKPSIHLKNDFEALLICSSNKTVWVFLGIQLAYFAVLLIAASVATFLIRKVHAAILWGESKFIAFCIYDLVLWAIVYVAALIAVADKKAGPLIVVAICTYFATTITLGCLVVWKIFSVLSGRDQTGTQNESVQTEFTPDEIPSTQ